MTWMMVLVVRGRMRVCHRRMQGLRPGILCVDVQAQFKEETCSGREDGRDDARARRASGC